MKTDFKPVYAENNPAWRIVYFPGGYWELQERVKLPEGTNRVMHQPWRTHNSRMSFDDAIVAIGGKRRER